MFHLPDSLLHPTQSRGLDTSSPQGTFISVTQIVCLNCVCLNFAQHKDQSELPADQSLPSRNPPWCTSKIRRFQRNSCCYTCRRLAGVLPGDGDASHERDVPHRLHVDLLRHGHPPAAPPPVLLQRLPHPGSQAVRQDEASVPDGQNALY